ncbi:MAG: sugar isomerase domain-containing protein, partial [[Clostridium] innocuum]|nr:sugar isomerase domain-containing protein [[Clostridium] innocuum]
MAFIDTYFKEVEQRFAVMKQEREPLEQAARLLFEAEKEHHTIYTFGSGHSHMIGQDIYARAGGYAKVYPINEIEMTLATHPTKSTTLERTASYADVLDAIYTIEAGDVLLVTSNSGRNPLVIEYTMRAREKGARIIVITSLSHSKTIASRHESGLRLFELADVILDNHAPYGDATTPIDEATSMGPVSTLTGCFLAQCV